MQGGCPWGCRFCDLRRRRSARESRSAAGRAPFSTCLRRQHDEILRFRGLTKDDPLRRVSREQLAATLRFFRFDEMGRALVDVGRPGATLVALRVRSVTHGGGFTLFARVSYPVVAPKLPERAGPPCPNCGHPLRTPRARQCGRCRLDWHDPANVFFRTSREDTA